MPVSDTPVTNADIVREMREWSGVHGSDRSLRDAVKASTGLDPLTAAWCAAYVNMALDDLGLPGTNSNLAKSFRSLGVPLDTPVPGTIAVFNRGNPNSIFGHVGVVSRVNPGTGTMDIIGGNQGDGRVTTSTRPISDAIAFRDVSQPGYAYSNSRFDTPSERMAGMRAREAMRADLTRPDAAVTAPYWDGTSAAPPVQAVESAPLGAISDFTAREADTGISADPYAYGQYSPANAVTGPVDFGGGLESANADYSAPGSFGGMLADRAAPTETYRTGETFGMEGPTPDWGGSLETANAGFTNPDAPVTGFEAVSTLGGPMTDTLAPDTPSSFGGMLADRAAPTETYRTGETFGEEAAPSSFGGRLADRAAPIETYTTADVFGIDAAPLGAPVTTVAPAPQAAPVQQEAPAKPNTTAAVAAPEYPLDVPAFAPLPELPTPINVAKAPTVAQPAVAPRPNATRPIERPAPIPTLRGTIDESAPAARSERVGLDRYDTPGGFLGGFLSGDRGAIGDLSRATGTDYTGLGMRAMGDDQYAQPAMLGLGNAWAEAQGQPGFKGIFDGLFGGSSAPTSPGWGTGGLYDPGTTSNSRSGGWSIGDIFTGENVGKAGGAVVGGALGGPLGGILGGYVGGKIGDYVSPGFDINDPARNGGTGGLYDPRDTEKGFFESLFGGFGWGGSSSDGLGTTPGSGGLY